jgi:tripartite-type tricarboxylate transporter receptor subunit TctC
VTDCTVWKTAPATTLKDVFKTEVIIGAFSKSSTTYQRPALLNAMLGTKIKIVLGYKGGSKVRLAMEKGEVHGFCGQFAGWKSRKPEWLKAGKLAHLVQFASKRSADMPNTPLFSEFAKTDEEREIFTFFQSGVEDRAMVAPPGVPAERVAALEKAYMGTLRDPVFVAAAKKIRFDVSPIPGAAIRKFVNATMQMKPATIAKLKKALGIGG